MEKLETFIEKIIFAGRWFLAPLYLGLLLTLVPILYRFFHSFWHMMTHVTEATAAEITLEVLELLDTVQRIVLTGWAPLITVDLK